MTDGMQRAVGSTDFVAHRFNGGFIIEVVIGVP